MIFDRNAIDGVFSQLSDPITIPGGDVPGADVQVGPDRLRKAKIILPLLLDKLSTAKKLHPSGRVVVSVCGGSGVGKSGIAALLTYALNRLGVGTYLLSGDNYPHRVPPVNDAERVRLFREAGYKALVALGGYGPGMDAAVKSLWEKNADSDPALVPAIPWLAAYQAAGADALRGYLGTPKEIDFDEVNHILSAFRAGSASLRLKRFGRKETEIWYDEVDFRATQVLLVEWTHGNSRFLEGVDLPVYLYCTPQETLAQRLERNRDGSADSPFVTMVLGIEQESLLAQAHRAAILVLLNGDVVSYDKFHAGLDASK
jgi:alpha-galactosidase